MSTPPNRPDHAATPDDMVTAMQLCRGNLGSAWMSHGGYKLVAEILLNNSHPQLMAMSYPKMTDGASS